MKTFQITIKTNDEITKEEILASFDLFEYEISEIIQKRKNRSNQQNKALHLYFTHLAEELNNAGYDMKKTMKVDISWTPHSIKEYIWRPLQETMLGKESTTKLKSGDIDKIYDTINKVIGERTGVYIPFPCEEELINQMR